MIVDTWKNKNNEIVLLKEIGKRGIQVEINGSRVGVLRRWGILPPQYKVFRLYITIFTNGKEQSIPVFITSKQSYLSLQKIMEKYKPKKK